MIILCYNSLSTFKAMQTPIVVIRAKNMLLHPFTQTLFYVIFLMVKCLYRHLGETRKAEGFLTDALNMFKKESWDMLSDHTRLEIAACQRILQDFPKYPY